MAFGIGDIGISDIIHVPTSVKYVIFLGLLGIGGIEWDLLGVKFRIAEFIFYPFSWALNGMGIFIDFELFYILMFVLSLVLFTLTIRGA